MCKVVHKLLSAPPDAPPNFCYAPWFGDLTHKACYLVGSIGNVTWPDAVRYCGTQNSRLASIHDDLESNVLACQFFFTIYANIHYHIYIFVAHLIYHRSYWIGGNVNLTQSRHFMVRPELSVEDTKSKHQSKPHLYFLHNSQHLFSPIRCWLAMDGRIGVRLYQLDATWV